MAPVKSNFDRFCSAPPKDLLVAFLYGPDGGLIRERASQLIKAILGEAPDPFAITELSGDQLKEDPARLPDEAAAIPMLGGRKAIRVYDLPNPPPLDLFKRFLNDLKGDTLVVVEAGDRQKSSAFVRLFEAADSRIAAIPCYRDEQKDLHGLVREMLSQSNRKINPEAEGFLVDRLGNDRQISRREIEKLLLYTASFDRPIQIEDIDKALGDNAEITTDDLVNAVGLGQNPRLLRAFFKLRDEGVDPIQILSRMRMHLQRLEEVKLAEREGVTRDAAIKSLRPPVFWKQAGAFREQVQLWSFEKLRVGLQGLTEAERLCKRTGYPSALICERALLKLSMASRAAKR